MDSFEFEKQIGINVPNEIPIIPSFKKPAKKTLNIKLNIPSNIDI